MASKVSDGGTEWLGWRGAEVASIGMAKSGLWHARDDWPR